MDPPTSINNGKSVFLFIFYFYVNPYDSCEIRSQWHDVLPKLPSPSLPRSIFCKSSFLLEVLEAIGASVFTALPFWLRICSTTMGLIRRTFLLEVMRVWSSAWLLVFLIFLSWYWMSLLIYVANRVMNALVCKDAERKKKKASLASATKDHAQAVEVSREEVSVVTIVENPPSSEPRDIFSRKRRALETLRS